MNALTQIDTYYSKLVDQHAPIYNVAGKKHWQPDPDITPEALKLMREALVSSIDESLSRISDDEMSFISKFRNTLNQKDFEDIIILLDENIRYLDRNANPKILFLDLSIKVSNLFKKVKS